MKKNYSMIEIILSLLISFVVSLVICIVYSLQVDEFLTIRWLLCAGLTVLLAYGILWLQHRDQKAQMKSE